MNVLKFVVPVALIVAGVWTMTADIAHAAERRAEVATVDVHPRMALAGRGGRVLVRIPRDADSRRLRVEVGSRSLVAVGEVALDGLASQDAYWFTLPALPAGYYFIKATVYGPNGPLSRADSQISRQ
jgi:hypothetical protein